MAKGDPRTGGAGYFPAIYQSALSQSAEDYDSLMDQYRSLGESVRTRPSEQLSYSPLTPTFVEYQPGSDYNYLRNFAQTGGYSEGDISDIRERSISPIRSIYDAASRNMSRQKNIQGGYSPNFGAVQAKLARDMSSAIGERITAANANIAQMVQQGKLAGATSLAPLEARETEARNRIAEMNANLKNQFAQINEANRQRIAEQNRQREDTDYDRILESIRGQQGVYGTTPALASTFGNQVLNAANITSNMPPVNRDIGTATGVRNPNVWSESIPTFGRHPDIVNKKQVGFGAFR